MPSNRLSRGFVSLAASAITAVYVAGYVHTQAADESLGTPIVSTPIQAVRADRPTPVSEPTPLAVASPPARPPAAARSTAIVITDQAVEEFANARHVSWDDARAQMEAAGGVSQPTTQENSSAAESTVGALAPIARAVATQPRSTATPTAVVHDARPSPTRAAAPVVVAGFRDGTFSGIGSSRRGDVQVSLVVQGGRVASVSITHATTQYPTRLIASLPGEVVSRQSAQVDLVSGATYSSLAFRGAVQQALQHARA